MGFDSEGNLYVTTGDTNSVAGLPNGYSGNNPIAKCPIGARRRGRRARTAARRTTPTRTRAERRATPTTTTARCCGSGRWRTSPRTAAAGRRARTYDAADRGLAQRPEPVQRHRGRRRQGQARDLRDGPAQPEPALDRPRDRRPVHGVGRPGRRQPERDAGPVDVRERGADLARRQLRLAVLHGLQAGLPRPPRRTAACARTAPRATCPAVPATGGTEGWYDCDNLRNDSPNNTGLIELPHQTGTGADAGKVRGNNLWWSRGNPGGANGCPEFPRPRARGRRRAELRRHADPGLPVRQRPGPDGHERPGLPLRRRARTTRAAGPSTGTAAGSCTTTAARASSTACCSIRTTDQDGGLPIYADGLRAHAVRLDEAVTSNSGSARTAHCTSTSTSFFRAGREHQRLPLRLHRRRAPTRCRPARVDRSTPTCVRFSRPDSGDRRIKVELGELEQVRGGRGRRLCGGQSARRDADGNLRRTAARTPRPSTSTSEQADEEPPPRSRRPATEPAQPVTASACARTVRRSRSAATEGRERQRRRRTSDEYGVKVDDGAFGDWLSTTRRHPAQAARRAPDRVPAGPTRTGNVEAAPKGHIPHRRHRRLRHGL